MKRIKFKKWGLKVMEKNESPLEGKKKKIKKRKIAEGRGTVEGRGFAIRWLKSWKFVNGPHNLSDITIQRNISI